MQYAQSARTPVGLGAFLREAPRFFSSAWRRAQQGAADIMCFPSWRDTVTQGKAGPPFRQSPDYKKTSV